MIEPAKPVVFVAKGTEHPAYPLERDEDVLEPGCYILRYRHLRHPAVASDKTHRSSDSADTATVTSALDRLSFASEEATSDVQVRNVLPVAPTLAFPARTRISSRLSRLCDDGAAENGGHSGSAPEACMTGSTPDASDAIRQSPSPPLTIRVPGRSSNARTGSVPVGGEQNDASLDTKPRSETKASLDSQAGKFPTNASSGISAKVSPLSFEHAIRSRDEKVRWYFSHGAPLEAVPVPPSIAQLSDLYIHRVGTELQVWLRVATPAWQQVEEGHPHPSIKGYVLRILETAEPRWVTEDTWRTYVGRWKKQAMLPSGRTTAVKASRSV